MASVGVFQSYELDGDGAVVSLDEYIGASRMIKSVIPRAASKLFLLRCEFGEGGDEAEDEADRWSTERGGTGGREVDDSPTGLERGDPGFDIVNRGVIANDGERWAPD